jgi:hypothetical protein
MPVQKRGFSARDGTACLSSFYEGESRNKKASSDSPVRSRRPNESRTAEKATFRKSLKTTIFAAYFNFNSL